MAEKRTELSQVLSYVPALCLSGLAGLFSPPVRQIQRFSRDRVRQSQRTKGWHRCPDVI